MPKEEEFIDLGRETGRCWFQQTHPLAPPSSPTRSTTQSKCTQQIFWRPAVCQALP